MDKKQLFQEALELLKSLISIPSVSRDEAKAADCFCTFLAAHEVAHHRHGNNIYCIDPHYDTNRPTLLLNAHIDTVKPVSGWVRDPFVPTVEGDRIYGLGSNDDGASLVSLLQTYRWLTARPQSYNVVFVASCEEEVSGKNGIESVLPLLPHIDVAMVGEPTGMQPAIAEKGLMVLDVTAHGKSGHAARNEGVNAIYKAMEDIAWFKEHTFEKQTDLLGPVKMSVTIIQAGTQHNVVPDACTFTVDIRSNECYTNEELYRYICTQVKSDVKARSFRLNSSRINPEHPLIRRCVEMGKVPFGSPTLSDQALMSFPSFKMGPGNSSRSHTADEFIVCSEIEQAMEEYRCLLDGLTL